MWKVVKQQTKTNNCSTPQSIIYNSLMLNKPKQIANVANVYFIEKIIKIQNEFKRSKVSALEILGSLLPKSKKKIFSLCSELKIQKN